MSTNFVRRGRMALVVIALVGTAPLGDDSPHLAAALDIDGQVVSSREAGKHTVVLELSEEPSAAAYDRTLGGAAEPKTRDIKSARESARLQATRVQRQQDRLAAILSQPPFDAELLYRSERTSNRLAIQIDLRHLARVRNLPGVKSAQVQR